MSLYFLINIPCWFKPRPLGRMERPAIIRASDYCFIGRGLGRGADPFLIFGFIPTGCFLIIARSIQRMKTSCSSCLRGELKIIAENPFLGYDDPTERLLGTFFEL